MFVSMFGNINGARRLRYLCTLWSTYCSDADIQYYPCSFVYSSSWYVSEKIANINGYVYMPGMILMFLIPVILRNCGARIVVRSCIGRVLGSNKSRYEAFFPSTTSFTPAHGPLPWLSFSSRGEFSAIRTATHLCCDAFPSPLPNNRDHTLSCPAQPNLLSQSSNKALNLL